MASGLNCSISLQTAVFLIEREHRCIVAGELSEAEDKRQALAAVADLRYDRTNYSWINDMTATMVMHPVKPELDGKDLSSVVDPTGKRHPI